MEPAVNNTWLALHPRVAGSPVGRLRPSHHDGWAPHVMFEGDDSKAAEWSRILLLDRKGDDATEWPEDLRVQQFPSQRSATTEAA